jgi:DASS family divalent anion:Na+ symporter
MNPGKRIHAGTIILLAFAAWFLPVPDGLKNTQANKARFIASKVNLPFEEVRLTVRLLKTDPKRSDAEISESARKQKKPLEADQVRRIREELAIAESQAAEQELELLTEDAWKLFVIFIATIAMILVDVMPIFICSLGALAIAILSGVLTYKQGYSGFSNHTIILIVVAFAIARGVVKSGLGTRIAYLVISKFGGSTLGLGYSLAVTDSLIAPSLPSNTARSGVVFPVTDSVARSAGSAPEDGTRSKLGAFLIMNSIAGLSISSGLWLTAMAANPMGVELAMSIDNTIDISFGSWLLASCVPSLVALAVVPYLLYRFFPPEVKKTPEAPAAAKAELKNMGPVSRDEWIMASTFAVLIGCWAMSKSLGINNTAVALGGLFVLMATNVISVDDIRSSNGPSTFVWFASLFTLSSHLDKFGFMEWIGGLVGATVNGWSMPIVYAVLLLSYILIHYFFVSQTAHMVAVFPIFLTVGLEVGLPANMLAMMLLLATNFFSPITPQASSGNAIFAGSGYLTAGEIYKNGGFVTLVNTIIYGTVGTAWIWFVFEYLV